MAESGTRFLERGRDVAARALYILHTSTSFKTRFSASLVLVLSGENSYFERERVSVDFCGGARMSEHAIWDSNVIARNIPGGGGIV